MEEIDKYKLANMYLSLRDEGYGDQVMLSTPSCVERLSSVISNQLSFPELFGCIRNMIKNPTTNAKYFGGKPVGEWRFKEWQDMPYIPPEILDAAPALTNRDGWIAYSPGFRNLCSRFSCHPACLCSGAVVVNSKKLRKGVE